MKVALKFEETDFKTLRSFEDAVRKQLGPHVYVGTDSLCWYFDYPKELRAMLRPFPEKVQLEFALESSQPDKK